MIFWTICPADERYLLYKRKLLVLWLVQNLELHVEVLWKKLEILHTYTCFTDPVSVNRWLNMKQANVNSRQHSHARDDTAEHINITYSMSVHVFIKDFIVNNPDNF